MSNLHSGRRPRARPTTALLFVVFVAAMAFGGTSGEIESVPDNGEVPVDTCNDGIDNDGDGQVDSLDLECDPLAPAYDGDENGDA